jgi:hypothetical protein
MILTVYKNLASIAKIEFTDIVVVTNIIFTPTHRAQKLRISLIDSSFIDIWLTLDGRYSYHWHSLDSFIYRHDNAPQFIDMVDILYASKKYSVPYCTLPDFVINSYSLRRIGDRPHLIFPPFEAVCLESKKFTSRAKEYFHSQVAP